MTRKAYQIILFTQLLIYGSLSALDEGKLRECLDAYYAKYIAHSSDVVFTPTQFVVGLPECVIKMKPGDADKCNLKSFSALSGMFECFNQWNHGSDIQQPGTTAVLWSGIQGEQGARQEVKDAKPGQKFIDKLVPACEVNVDVLNKMKKERDEKGVTSVSDEQRRMFFGLTFLWLIWNSNPEDHSYTIKQFSSIKVYEEDRINGRKNLMEKGVTEALTINNFFWNIELPSIARLFTFKLHGNNQITPKLEINLLVYENGKPVPNTVWHKYNLFGNDGLDKIHVIYYDRPKRYIYPLLMEKTSKTTGTFQDLINKYNAGQANNELKVKLPIYLNVRALLEFVEWVSKLPFNGGVSGISFDALSVSDNMYKYGDEEKNEFVASHMHSKLHSHTSHYNGFEYGQRNIYRKQTEQYSDHYNQEIINDLYLIIYIVIFIFICCVFGGITFICGICYGFFAVKLFKMRSSNVDYNKDEMDEIKLGILTV